MAQNLLRRAARGGGFDLTRAGYYSPVVNTALLPDELWERAAPMPGIELDLDRQLAFLREQLSPLVAELRVPLTGTPGRLDLHLDNPWYGPMDAQILYAMVRLLRPERVLELGSGYSTLLIGEARRHNGGQGWHDVVDPFPSELLQHEAPPWAIRRQSAADLPTERFEELVAGDLLFIDTSHTVRPGGEVVRLVLEVLPRLAAGVVVHFHDIFRPFEYPRILYERFNVHWQEQYLVQAFLADNPNFRIVCSNHALWRLRRDRVQPLFEGLREGMQPSGFWIVRNPPPAPLNG